MDGGAVNILNHFCFSNIMRLNIRTVEWWDFGEHINAIIENYYVSLLLLISVTKKETPHSNS